VAQPEFVSLFAAGAPKTRVGAPTAGWTAAIGHLDERGPVQERMRGKLSKIVKYSVLISFCFMTVMGFELRASLFQAGSLPLSHTARPRP
jgi:hypothetical protein